MPGPETVPGAEEALKEQWEQETGLRLHLNEASVLKKVGDTVGKAGCHGSGCQWRWHIMAMACQFFIGTGCHAVCVSGVGVPCSSSPFQNHYGSDRYIKIYLRNNYHTNMSCHDFILDDGAGHCLCTAQNHL